MEVTGSMATIASSRGTAAPPSRAWRTRDIVVTAIIGVTFGVVFWVWNARLGGRSTRPSRSRRRQGPAVRRLARACRPRARTSCASPGAAVFAEMVAAGVSAILGSQWGADALISGFVQGPPPSSCSRSRCIASGRSRSSRSAAVGVGRSRLAPRLGAVLHGRLARGAAASAA